MSKETKESALRRRRFMEFCGWGALAALFGAGASRTELSGGWPVSDHCDGRRFFNPRNHVNPSFADIVRWRRHAKPAPWPKWVDYPARTLPQLQPGQISATWINHATFLLRGPFGAILTDPVFSMHAGPWGRIGPRRVHAPGLPLEALPRIDAVLLSHDHYDHCDVSTLSILAKRDRPLLVTPLGNGDLARRAGLRQVVELDWWQSTRLEGGAELTVTPARHWSNRVTGPRNGRLWGGFSLAAAGRRIHFTGDTGAEDRLFPEIQARLGAPDLALIPIGAYEPRWFMAPQHCSPEQAVAIHQQLGARQSIGMHWGCFQLTDESRDEPLRLLQAELDRRGLDRSVFLALDPGESLVQ